MATLVCLHGWGGSKASFDPMRDALKQTDITVLTPDLPGFGTEPEPKTPWTVDDYADWVEHWIHTHHKADESLYLLGHSHGGRISIKLANRQSKNQLSFSIEHLYLCASAGIYRPRHFKRIIGLTLAKTGKFFLSIPGFKTLAPLGKKLLYKLVRVHDYERASPLMQQTLILVTREDLRSLLPTITTPTDIFWGKQDGMTPIADAYMMNDEIPQSTLHTYDNVRHGVHKDKAQEIAAIIIKQCS